MNLKSKITIGVTSFISVLVITSFFLYNYVLDIETPFPKIESENVKVITDSSKPVIYFGVISRYSPSIIYEGYQPLMDFLTANTQYTFELRLSSSYQETVRQLVDGEVSAAFLGSFIYLKARKEFGIKAILKPLNENHEPYFQSVLITKQKSKIYSVGDLKNKKLALPSKQSFSGNWLTLYEMSKFNLTLTDLDSIHHFAHHHTVVHQIIMDNFDAGVVKDRVAKEFLDEGIRIVAQSDPIPGSPVVIPKNYDPKILNAIVNTLLKIDPQKLKYREVVKDWDKEFVNGFVKASDEDYNSMNKLLEGKKKK